MPALPKHEYRNGERLYTSVNHILGTRHLFFRTQKYWSRIKSNKYYNVTNDRRSYAHKESTKIATFLVNSIGLRVYKTINQLNTKENC